MHHFIVTGPESSGKTTLARELAAATGGVYVPEYPRGYLLAAGRRAVASDFAHFAATAERLAALGRTARHPRPIVQDTGAEVLYVWLRDKFPRHDAAPLHHAFVRQRPTAYLLCRPDLPWTPDALREDRDRRDELLDRYRALLADTPSEVIEVFGRDADRVRRVARALARRFGVL